MKKKKSKKFKLKIITPKQIEKLRCSAYKLLIP